MVLIVRLKMQTPLTEAQKEVCSPRRGIHSFEQRVLWEALPLRPKNCRKVYLYLNIISFPWIVISPMIILFDLCGT